MTPLSSISGKLRAWRAAVERERVRNNKVVRPDQDNCPGCLASGGVIVLDDVGLTSNFRPPLFATAGHPGPSRLAEEISHPPFAEILQVGHNRVFQEKSA